LYATSFPYHQGKDRALILSQNQTIVLYLLRAYNDLDHIAPIIWKTASCGMKSVFVFVDKDFSDDYRIKHIKNVGSKQLVSESISFYFTRIRRFIRPNYAKKVVDRLVGMIFGTIFLMRNNIGCVVTEWGGPDGKGLARLILRPARKLDIPTLAVPHGYHTWLNDDFNEVTACSIRQTKRLPQFNNRNLFSAYVVQSANVRRYCIESGIDKQLVHVLGSARFSKEWSEINYNLCVSPINKNKLEGITTVVFFLNHWTYNVDREKCLSLLKRIAGQEDTQLVIKGHTRGRSDGGLSISEEKSLGRFKSLIYADDRIHSPELVHQADVVVVYGSSICFEALRQRKLVCWPKYICRNRTIFDESGVVVVANNEQDVINTIQASSNGKPVLPDESELDHFFTNHVEGGRQGCETLQNYTQLIASYNNK